MPPLHFPTHEPKLIQNSCLKPNYSCSVISPPPAAHHDVGKALGPWHSSPFPQIAGHTDAHTAHTCGCQHTRNADTHACSQSLTPQPEAAVPIDVTPSWPAHQPEDEVDGEHSGHAAEWQPFQDGAAGAGTEALLLRAVHKGVQEAEHVQRRGASTVWRRLH